MDQDDLHREVSRLLGLVGRRDSLERHANVKEAIRLADAANDDSLSVELRCIGAEGAVRCGQVHEGLVMHSWVLGKIEQDRGLRDRFLTDIVHNDSFLAQSVPDFVEISRAEIDALFEQLFARRVEAGEDAFFARLVRLVTRISMGRWRRERVPLPPPVTPVRNLVVSVISGSSCASNASCALRMRFSSACISVSVSPAACGRDGS